jgi:hypothetical protein
MDVIEVGWKDWFRAVVDTVMNFRDKYNTGEFCDQLSSC